MSEDITLILGDCLEKMANIPSGSVDCIITDPVWPNSLALLKGSENPYQLFHAAAKIFCKKAKLIIVHLGCSSDPRFLNAIPKYKKFIRVCWLRYNFPSFRGRILVGSDVAYLFGDIPKSRKGFHLLSGECATKDKEMMISKKRKNHPTPRKLNHLFWLVDKFSKPGDLILDPFMGSGTTGVACKELGRKFIGIEIHKPYFDIAQRRIDQATKDMFV